MNTKIKNKIKENEYLNFLFHVIGEKSYEYSLLLEHLHTISFYSSVPNDSNRGKDGEKLRDIFIDEVGQHGSSFLPNETCTLLEMLIGLSYRMENECEGRSDSQNAADYFWMLIEHLNLHWCDDYSYHEESGREVINKVSKIFLNRKYDRNGNGGLFPLRKSRQDQRKVEIWYQMQEYLMENYEW